MISWRGNHPPDEFLYEYLDGELDVRSQEAIASHLSGCEACRLRSAGFEALFAAIGSVPAVPYNGEVVRVVARSLKQRERASFGLRWVAAAQAAIMIMLILIVNALRISVGRIFTGLASAVLGWQAWISSAVGSMRVDTVDFGNALLKDLYLVSTRPLQHFSIPLSTQALLVVMLAVFIAWAAGNSLLLWQSRGNRQG
jgi:predicted anti-sigma-YlaC factor YlaD